MKKLLFITIACAFLFGLAAPQSASAFSFDDILSTSKDAPRWFAEGLYKVPMGTMNVIGHEANKLIGRSDGDNPHTGDLRTDTEHFAKSPFYLPFTPIAYMDEHLT